MATSAVAQSPYKGGMNYTAVRKSNATPPHTQGKNFIHHKSVKEIEQTNDTTYNTADEKAQDLSPAQDAWLKYKALAAGTPEPDNDKRVQTLNTGTQNTAPPPTHQPPTQAGGIAGLLQKYNQNKEKRGQLRSIKQPKPTLQSINRPNTSSPSIATPTPVKVPTPPPSYNLN